MISSTPTVRPTEFVRAANPEGALRMSATPSANGVSGPGALDLPDFRDYASTCQHRPCNAPSPPVCSVRLMRDLYRRNPTSFRLFCPDETNSNRLGAVFEVSDRAFAERGRPTTTSRSRDPVG